MPQENQNIQIRSEEVQEILSYVPSWMIRWGNTLIFVLILTLLFISWFVKYPDILQTEVIITTKFPPEKLYARVNGKLDAFLVANDSKVDKNEVLAVIENSAEYKDVLLLKSIIDTVSLNKENFSFPIDKLPSLILGDIINSFSQFENDYTEFILNSELNPYSPENNANKMSVIEARGRLQILLSQKDLNKKELSFKAKDLQRSRSMYEKGVISTKEIEQKELEYLQAERSYKSLGTSISQIREMIGNSKNNLKGTSIKKTQSDTRLLNKAFQSFYQLKKTISDWERQYVIKSSISGKVSFLSYWSQNQTVKAGDLVFTIIPDKNTSFIGKIKAPVNNSGKIKIGQQVQMKLLNYPSDEFGELNGTVKLISQIPDEQGNYLIDVELPNKLITTYNKEIEFRQEMKGAANIITEDLRLMERFFYQLKNIIKK